MRLNGPNGLSAPCCLLQPHLPPCIALKLKESGEHLVHELRAGSGSVSLNAFWIGPHLRDRQQMWKAEAVCRVAVIWLTMRSLRDQMFAYCLCSR